MKNKERNAEKREYGYSPHRNCRGIISRGLENSAKTGNWGVVINEEEMKISKKAVEILPKTT